MLNKNRKKKVCVPPQECFNLQVTQILYQYIVVFGLRQKLEYLAPNMCKTILTIFILYDKSR